MNLKKSIFRKEKKRINVKNLYMLWWMKCLIKKKRRKKKKSRSKWI